VKSGVRARLWPRDLAQYQKAHLNFGGRSCLLDLPRRCDRATMVRAIAIAEVDYWAFMFAHHSPSQF